MLTKKDAWCEGIVLTARTLIIQVYFLPEQKKHCHTVLGIGIKTKSARKRAPIP